MDKDGRQNITSTTLTLLSDSSGLKNHGISAQQNALTAVRKFIEHSYDSKKRLTAGMRQLFAPIILIIFTSCQISINKDHVAEGTRLMQQGDYFNADIEFDDALFSDNNNLDALRGSYMCALNMGHNEKALKRANKFIELRPDSSVGYNDRGTVFLLTKQCNKALEDFNKVLERGTDYPAIAYFNKGEALRELNRDKEAIRCYNFVTSKDKRDVRAFYRMGQSYKKMGIKDSACLSFKIAMDLGDRDAEKEYSTKCN